jgi:hypothetical protein
MRPGPQAMLAGSIVLITTLASAIAHDGEHLCGTPSMAPSEKLRQLQAAKAPETFRDSQYVAYRDAAEITWTFTQPANPAHPAVVCRRIVGPEGKPELETDAECHASGKACEAMMADFAKLNAAMMEAMKSQVARPGR